MGKYKITMTPVKRSEESKKAMIMQLAGSTCDNGFTWDPITMQCIPDVPQDPNRPKSLYYNNSGSPTNFRIDAATDNKGNILQSDVIPTTGKINSQGTGLAFDPLAGTTDSRGTFIPQQQRIGDAIDQGFNLDSDGKYRKTKITTDPNHLDYSPFFQTLNLGLDAVRGVAGAIGSANLEASEKRKLEEARLRSRFGVNPYERGLNQLNIYSQNGGDTTKNTQLMTNRKYQVAGQVDAAAQPQQQDMQQMAQQGPVPTDGQQQPQDQSAQLKQLVVAIAQQLQKGISPAEITKSLLKMGFSKAQAKEIIAFVVKKLEESKDSGDSSAKEGQEGEGGQEGQENPGDQEGPGGQEAPGMQDGGQSQMPDQNSQAPDSNGQPADPNAQPADQNGQMQQIIQEVAKALQQGQNPDDIVKSLIQAGVPQDQAQQIVQQVVQSMSSGGGQQTAQNGGFLQCPPKVDMGYNSGEGTGVGNFLRTINPFKRDPNNVPDPYYNNPNYLQDRVQFMLNNEDTGNSRYPIHSLNPTRTSKSGRQFYEAEYTKVQKGGAITPKFTPKYNFPSAYMFNHVNPQFNPQPSDSANYLNMFNKALADKNMNADDYFKIAQGFYDPIKRSAYDAVNGIDAARGQYLSNMIYGNAILDARNQQKVFANGGNVNNTGYTPGTSTYNNSFNIIPSNNITMENTPFPVMAYPENGDPTLMMPGSKHMFGDSKYVTEIPMAKGGKVYTDKEIAAGMLKHKLSKAAKKHFTFVLEGKIPMHGHTKDAKAKGTYQMGGSDNSLVPQADSNPNGNAILERGEVFTNPSNNTIEQVAQDEPTHDGSKAVTSQEGTAPGNDGSVQVAGRVLENTSSLRKDLDSKLLKVSKDTAYALTGFMPKSSISHAKLYKDAVDDYKNKVDKIQKAIDFSLVRAKQGNGGQFAENSLNHNVSLLSSIPTAGDLFDKLYNHQETVKQMFGIDNGGNAPKQYGGGKYLPVAQNGSDVSTYPGGVTQEGRIMPDGNPNPFNFPGGWDSYKKLWKDNGLDLSMFKTNQEVQGAVYDFMLKTHPEVIKAMWKHGNTAHGLGLPNALPKTFSNDFLNSTDNLQKLRSSYTDGFLGARTLQPYDAQAPAAPSNVDNRPPVNTNYMKPDAIKASTFSAPLKWYDVYSDAAALADSYNLTPVQFEQLKRDPLQAHLLNPQPTLNENTGVMHAIQDQMPNNGAGNSNKIALASNAYKADNNVLGAYADKNQQILDSMDKYNDQTQYGVDTTNLNLRMNAYKEMLATREAAREQGAASTAGLMNKIATNAALNVNGNIAMKLFPHFNQNIEFNGNPYQLLLGPDGAPMLFNKQTGEKYTMVTKRDADGQIKGTTQVVKGTR